MLLTLVVLAAIFGWTEWSIARSTRDVSREVARADRFQQIGSAAASQRDALLDYSRGAKERANAQLVRANTTIVEQAHALARANPEDRSGARALIDAQQRYRSVATRTTIAVDQHRDPGAVGLGRAEDAAYGDIAHTLKTAREHARIGLDKAFSSVALTRTTSTFMLAVALLGGLLLVRLMGRVLRSYRAEEATEVGLKIARLEEVARTDQLTGLGNRRAFLEDISEALEIASPEEMTCLAMVDLDGLKHTNETFGHMAGDERIRGLASTLLEECGHGGLPYRLGGDEFAVILTGSREIDGFRFVQRMQAILRVRGEGEDPPTIAAGIAALPAKSPEAELRRRADLALIAAKDNHNQVLVYTPEVEVDAVEIQTLKAPDPELQRDLTLATAVAKAVNAKDPEREGHAHSVSELARSIAQKLDLEPKRCDEIRIAGLLCDVGMLGVSNEVLHASTSLTDEQRKVIESHATLGGTIVDAAGLQEIGLWIRHHHERIDGKGYPDGLAGEEIPLESRILFVADAFCGMTSRRTHRKSMTPDNAIFELQRNAATQFDPRCVKALRNLIEAPKEKIA